MSLAWRSYATTNPNTGMRNAIQLIDQAMYAAGWTQASGNSYDFVAAAGYANDGSSPLPGDPSGLATSAEYFRIVYTMNDSLSATSGWKVWIQWKQGGAVGTYFAVTVKIGKTVSGSGSTVDLSDGSTAFGLNSGSSYAGLAFADWFFNAYESGFCMSFNYDNVGNNTFVFGVERCRDFSGVITHDLAAASYGNDVYTINSGQAYVYRHSGGLMAVGPMLGLFSSDASKTDFSGGNYTSVSQTIAGSGNTQQVMVGPYIRGGSVDVYGRPRLVTWGPKSAFSTRKTNVTIKQDGVDRTFYVPGEHSPQTYAKTILFAKA